MSIYCTSVADASLGEKDLKEDSREQGTADADVGLDTSSEDTEAEYKFVLIVVLAGTWHCVCTTNASFHVDRHCPGLTLGSSGYVVFLLLSFLCVKMHCRDFLLLLFHIYIDFFEEYL